MAIINRNLNKKRISNVDDLIYKRAIHAFKRVRGVMDRKNGKLIICEDKKNMIANISERFFSALHESIGRDMLAEMFRESERIYSRGISTHKSLVEIMPNILLIDKHSPNFEIYTKAVSEAYHKFTLGDFDSNIINAIVSQDDAIGYCIRTPLYRMAVVGENENTMYVVPAIIPVIIMDISAKTDRRIITHTIVHELAHTLDYCNKINYLKKIKLCEDKYITRYLEYYEDLFNRDTEIVAYLCMFISALKYKNLTRKEYKVIIKKFIKSKMITSEELNNSELLNTRLDYKNKR